MFLVKAFFSLLAAAFWVVAIALASIPAGILGVVVWLYILSLPATAQEKRKDRNG